MLAVGEPPGRALGGMHAAQVRRDHLTRQEVVLHEVAEDLPDALFARGDDGGVRDRQAERMPEQRRDREPVGQAAHERRFGGRPHVAEPGVERLVDACRDEYEQRDPQ